MTREKYESLPLATLKELAKARKMRGVSTLKKGDLIDAMLELDEQEEQKEAEHHHDVDGVFPRADHGRSSPPDFSSTMMVGMILLAKAS